MQIKLAGENSLIIYLIEKITPALNQKITNLTNHLRENLTDVIIDITPSYNSIHIYYNLNLTNFNEIKLKIKDLFDNFDNSKTNSNTKIINIPVLYNFQVGLDLENLLKTIKLSLEEFINLHSNKEYLVYAVGFMPNFAFLAEVHKKLQFPRVQTPRLSVPKGSVGIANNQTGVYPTNSPGGWNIIGKTPIDLSIKSKILFNIGDKVRFNKINQAEFIALGGEL